MADTEQKTTVDELIKLSVAADKHEDTLMLILHKNEAKPLSREQLLDSINGYFRDHNKVLWNEDDLNISIGLLTQQGLIAPSN